MIAFPFTAEVLSSQRNDIRQIQVVPFHPTIVHTFEARVEATTDVNHPRLRVTAKEIPGVAVEFAGEYDPHYLEQFGHRDLSDPGKVEAHLRNQFHCVFILQYGVRALALHRPVVERNKQRLRYAAQVLVNGLSGHAALSRVDSEKRLSP